MQNNKKSWKTKARNYVAGGLVGLTGLLAGCQEGAQIKTNPIKASVKTSYVSDWVVPGGGHIAGTSTQTTAIVSKGPLTLWSWYSQALDKKDKGKKELDVGINYTHNIKEGLFTENDKLLANVGAMVWTYPNKVLGENSDYLATARLNYKGPVDVSVGVAHMFKHEGVTDGDSITGKISKTFSLYENKDKNESLSITPSLASAYTRDFYGTDGWRHITPGISLDYNKGNFCLSGFIKKQESLNEKTTEDNLVYGGINATWRF